MPLHPKIAAILKATAHLPRPPDVPVNQARQNFRERVALLPPATETLDAVEDRLIDGRLRVRLYRPRADAPLPLLMFFHGGGFVLGDLDTHDGLCRRLSARAGCVVLAVDYRLAPEHPFPAGLDDCWLATCWAAKNAAEFGADAGCIALAGDSAGGTLAAATAIQCRDLGGPALRAQVLLYPALTHYSAAFPSWDELASGFGLTRDSMVWYWDQYLGAPRMPLPAGAVPLQSTKHADLPPTLVITAEFDLLRDEGERYASLLAASGVAACATRYERMNHGFAALSGVVEEADSAIAEACAWLRTHLA